MLSVSRAHRGLLGVAGKSVQQLLRRLEGSDEACDEDGFAVHIQHGGETGPVRKPLARVLLEALARQEQTLDFLRVKLYQANGKQ